MNGRGFVAVRARRESTSVDPKRVVQAFKVLLKSIHFLVTVFSILCEGLAQDGGKRRRRVRHHLIQGWRVLVDDVGQRLGDRSRLKRRTAAHHFEYQNAEAEYVGAFVQGLAACLFGRHVVDRPNDRTDGGVLLKHGVRI